MTLDEIGLSTGTDKSSLLNDYLRHYETLFSNFKEQSINVIEIGVSRGYSIATWKRFFTQATIVGLDIQPNCGRFADERTVIRIGSQDDAALLAELTDKYPPMIAIDDGSHRADHIVFTFEHLFPALLPGGFYVIEDLFVHFGNESYRGEAKVLPQDYLAAIAMQIMAGRHLGGRGIRPQIIEAVDTLQFIGRAAIIRKKGPEPAEDPVARAMQLTAEIGTAAAWDRLAELLSLMRGGHLDQAEAAARKAIELDAEAPAHLRRLADVLRRKGDQAGADAANGKAAALEARRGRGMPPDTPAGAD